MKPLTRIAAIVAGYLLAFLLAVAVVALDVALTDGPDRQASAGMASFGDAFLFLGVFGLAAIPPTAAALWALRGYRGFWLGLIVGGAVSAATGLVSLIAYFGWRADRAYPCAQWLSMLTPVRMLFAPMLAMLLIVAALCAPSRGARIALGGAALIEVLAFVCFVAVLFGSYAG